MAAFLEKKNIEWDDFIAEAEKDSQPLDVHTAASLCDEQVVLEALERDPGLAVNRNDLGWSPLMFAAWHGHASLVVLLLRAAQLCGQDAADPALGRLPRSGRTLLMIAARFGYMNIVQLLSKPNNLEARDFRGQTALFHAVRGGNVEIVQFFLSLGANVNACDSQGQTVLRLAERCRPETSKLLRHAGAKLEVTKVPSRFLRTSPLGMAAAAVNDIAYVLEGIGLQKYLPIFQLHGIDFKGLLAMSEEDLRRVGVSLLGPRRKLSMEIDRLKSLYGHHENS